ncbi:MAG: KpsF/GutQ family sugar-phosphate isomerase [Thiohalomonadales bacterium]
MTDKDKICELARAVLDTEADAIRTLKKRIDMRFAAACELLLNCTGRIVVMGMGKSGHIANKTAATLASTGTPAFFVHPGEASHGDMGMITADDVVVVYSNSGETDELVRLLPLLKRLGVGIVSLTGNTESTLALAATVHLDVSVEKEACPLGLAPTASTTAAMAMGDALAISLLEARGFTANDFALSHPGGQLGRNLLLHVDDIMHKDEKVPSVLSEVSLYDALIEITQKSLGMTTIVDNDRKVVGMFTDGDLRRVLDRGQIDIKKIKISEVMIPNCKTVNRKILAVEVLHMMQKHKINSLPVVDNENRLVGALNMHNLLIAGVV